LAKLKRIRAEIDERIAQIDADIARRKALPDDVYINEKGTNAFSFIEPQENPDLIEPLAITINAPNMEVFKMNHCKLKDKRCLNCDSPFATTDPKQVLCLLCEDAGMILSVTKLDNIELSD
jgi:hypothetical protein